jgi:hypothetical protein
MSVSTKYIFATTILLLVALINDARAQAELPFGPGYFQNDLQMFAPLELDLNNAPRQLRLLLQLRQAVLVVLGRARHDG